ncbi:MAG: YraN family protein [Oscillospiraceae bacterium]|jgi:putative endonuclease|nr:YraN family protein [Oscillospiraceae bacterium]
MDNKLLGRWGESLAAQYLQRKQYTIVAANYHCRGGEIDLIAQKRGYIVFVEVKLRKDARFAQAREFVDRHKCERIVRAAQLYLSLHEEITAQPRFDVIEIYAPDGMKTESPTITHLEDAFQ